MRRGRLRNFVVRLGLDRMDQVRKLDRVLNEKNRHIVANEVPDPFVGIKLDREAAHVASAVSRPAGAGDGRESHEDRRLPRRIAQETGHSQVRKILIDLEHAVRRCAARMDNPLRYALVIEVGDFFAEVKVLHQSRTAQSGLQRVLIVGNLDALVSAQNLARLNGVEREVRCLVGFRVEGFLVDGRGGLAGSTGCGPPRDTA